MDASAAPTSDCEPLTEGLRMSDDASSGEEDNDAKGSFTAYPNPFPTAFQLSFDNNRGEWFNVVIYSIDGEIKARYEGLSADERHALGEKLEPGLYFLRITSQGKSETKRLVKR